MPAIINKLATSLPQHKHAHAAKNHGHSYPVRATSANEACLSDQCQLSSCPARNRILTSAMGDFLVHALDDSRLATFDGMAHYIAMHHKLFDTARRRQP